MCVNNYYSEDNNKVNYCVEKRVAKGKIFQNHNQLHNQHRKSKKTKITIPVLPQVTGYDATINSVICAGSEKSIPMRDFWSKECLIDEFTQRLLKIIAKSEFGIICNDTNSSSQMYTSEEEFERGNCLSRRKYLIRAQRAIATYCDGKPIIFVVNLSDLTDRLKAELIDLTQCKSLLGDMLHSVVQRIFAAVSSNWFYESAAEEIEVLIQP
jgi:hypothetical protein